MKKVILLFIALFSNSFAFCDFVLQFNKEEMKILNFYTQKLEEYESRYESIQTTLNQVNEKEKIFCIKNEIGCYVESVDDSMGGMIEISAYMKYFYENKIVFQDEEQSLFQQAFNLMKRRAVWYDHFQCSNTVFENCLVQPSLYKIKCMLLTIFHHL